MSEGGLMPYQPEPTEHTAEPAIVSIGTEDEQLEALTSNTAREVLSNLYERPAPASGVARQVGTSLQNAMYPLGRLQEAGLITTVGTWYSSRGAEMSVFAPSRDPLVFVAGSSSDTNRITRTLSGPEEDGCDRTE